MEKLDLLDLQRFRDVHLIASAGDGTAVLGNVGPQVVRLSEVIRHCESLIAEQEALSVAMREATPRRQGLRATLERDYLKPLSALAEVVFLCGDAAKRRYVSDRVKFPT